MRKFESGIRKVELLHHPLARAEQDLVGLSVLRIRAPADRVMIDADGAYAILHQPRSALGGDHDAKSSPPDHHGGRPHYYVKNRAITGQLQGSSYHGAPNRGAAGCFPVLVGWSAVTGRVGLPAIVLFAVIFFWTPPHFWSLALLLRRQYRDVGVPMLPVVSSDLETRRSIVIYAVVLLVVSLLPGIWLGPLYTLGAAVLGGAFVAMSLRGLTSEGLGWAARLFHFSLGYLAVLFGLAAVSAVLPH